MPDAETVWYFAYGSNIDSVRFRARVGPWLERRPAILENFRVSFSGDVRSEGGGGAFVYPSPGDKAYGAVMLVTRAQMRAIDEIEMSPERNVEGRGVHMRHEVSTPDGLLRAELHTVTESRTFLAPSPKYLEHILLGLRGVGHPQDVLDRVRRSAERTRET